MIKMPRKEPITIPATSPPLKHTSEIEGMVSQGGELIKIMSLEAQTNKRRQRKKNETRGGEDSKKGMIK